jgi:hypothetical protein
VRESERWKEKERLTDRRKDGKEKDIEGDKAFDKY